MRSPPHRRDGTGTPVTGGARPCTATSGRRPVGADLHRDGHVEWFREGGERGPDVVPRQVPGVRAHAHERRHGRPVEPEPLAVHGRRHRLQVRLERGRQPGRLVRVDAQQAQRPDQLPQVVGRGGDDDEAAVVGRARGRSPGRCAARTRPAPGRRRGPRPAAAPRCRPPRRPPAGARGRPGGRRTGTSRAPRPPRRAPVQDPGEVVAGTAAEVEQGRGRPSPTAAASARVTPA